MSDDKYIGHKLELILDEIKAVHELVADQPTRGEFAELKQDMKVVKAAVTAINRDLAKHNSVPAHVAHGHA